MIGSSCYSISSFLYLLVTTRILGTYAAGFFSLSYATAQLLLSVGRFGMRTFQATDLEAEYSFREYKVSRIISCGLMLLMGVIYSIVSFSGTYIIISIFVIVMKMIDAVEDVYHGNLQQNYNVELMGKLLAARNIYSALSYIIALMWWKDLGYACVFCATTSLLLCLYINIYFTSKYNYSLTGGNSLRWDRLYILMKRCLPIFGGTFLSLLLYNIPKYAMSNILTDDYQAVYSILFMPSFVILMMCEFVFKPTITTIASLWFADDIKRFCKYVIRIMLVIFGFSVGIVIGGDLLGRRLLEIIYGVELFEYRIDFIILLVGGGICSAVYMIYNILIAIRRGNCILVVYGITSVITALISHRMVSKMLITGAALNYLFSCTLLLLLFGFILVYEISKKKTSHI